MKRKMLLLSFLALRTATAMAQLTESEPNDSLSAANALPLNTTMSGSVCNVSAPSNDWFKIVLPVDGYIKIRSTVSSNISATPAQALELRLMSPTGTPYNSFNPLIGNNGAGVADSFIWANRAAGTYYIRAGNGIASATNVCLNYTFSCSVTPATFINDAEPDNYPAHPIPLAYNTPTEGHLGFNTEPTYNPDGDDYYTIVTPADGVLRVITETEAYSPGTNMMYVTVYNKSDVPLYNQPATPGAFQHPHIDTLYWPCISKDTFRIKLETNTISNGGYAYRLRYDVIQPVFGADAEPNNSYAAARVVNPNNAIEGHHYFYGATDYDYYKFYKPDTGYLKVYLKAETWGAATNQTYVVRLETKTQGYIINVTPRIGANAQPALDSIVVASLPADSFFISVQNSSIYQSCISYQLKIRSSGITGIGVGVPAVVNPEFNIYPNPSNGSFSIAAAINLPAALVRVYNIYGQTLFSQTMELPSRSEIHLSDITPGIYYVEVADGQHRWVRKLRLQ